MNKAVMNIEDLSCHFGGLKAVNGISLDCLENQIHAVIGPNGAGKSTLINIIAGDIVPTEGFVKVEGQNIIGLPSNQISRLGVGRVYQTTNIFNDLTVFENCRLASQTQLDRQFGFFRRAEKYELANELAEVVLERVNLNGKKFFIVDSLSHGDQKKVEIAMILATRPKLLILDEPLAGMSAEETSMIVTLIRSLKEEHSILIVEHDVEAVLSIASTVSVMSSGKIVKVGTPKEVRSDPFVQEVYFGKQR